jgi:dihydrofolate reductase
MGKIVVDTFLTLDGVMQAPGGSDEDREDGFTHGGWQFPLSDEQVGEFIGEGVERTEALLLGRKTYDIFTAYWPNVPEPDEGIAKVLNSVPKHVASRTLTSVSWQNSTLLGADVPAAVTALREQPGGEIHVIGSGDLVQTLISHDLVDEYRLIIYPLLLGTGKKLFAGGTVPTGLELVESRSTPRGAILCVYRRGGEITYGTYE